MQFTPQSNGCLVFPGFNSANCLPSPKAPLAGGTAEPPLGILRFSRPLSGGDERAQARLRKFALLALSRSLLPHRRVKFCLRGRAVRGKPVRVHGGDGRAHFGNLMRCGMPWICPCCAPRIAEVRRGELARGVAWGRAHGYEVFLSTLTVAHGRQDALQDTKDAIGKAYRHLMSTRAYKAFCARYGLAHSVKSSEVTVGDWHGWHPHFHVLHFVRSGVDRARFQLELAELWIGALEHYGFVASVEHGVNVKRTTDAVDKYVAKWGRPWTYADEMTKAHSKTGRGDRSLTPFDLLRKIAELPEGAPGRAQYVAWWREFDDAYFRSRQLRWSPGLRGAVGLGAEKSDEELAAESERFADMTFEEWLELPDERAEVAEPDTLPVLAELSWADWALVLHYERRGQLLAVACEGDAGKVRAFVRALREHYEREKGAEDGEEETVEVGAAETSSG